MDQKTYLAERIDNQIDWYEKKSKSNQNKYKTLKTIVIITSVSIPFLAGLIKTESDITKIAVGIGGVLIAAIEGVLALNKYQDLWLEYRLAAEMLKQEKIIFSTQSGPYENKKNTFKLFVTRAESIMSSENKNWLQNQQKEDDSES